MSEDKDKTLGQIAHEAGEQAGRWERKWHHLSRSQKVEWEEIADVVAGHVRASLAQQAGEDARDGWQPIATAPKDGTEVMMFVPEHEEQFVAYWLDSHFVYAVARDGEPIALAPLAATHWRPLPPPPAIDQAMKGGA